MKIQFRLSHALLVLGVSTVWSATGYSVGSTVRAVMDEPGQPLTESSSQKLEFNPSIFTGLEPDPPTAR
jgi:hypothetical protein